MFPPFNNHAISCICQIYSQIYAARQRKFRRFNRTSFLRTIMISKSSVRCKISAPKKTNLIQFVELFYLTHQIVSRVVEGLIWSIIISDPYVRCMYQSDEMALLLHFASPRVLQRPGKCRVYPEARKSGHFLFNDIVHFRSMTIHAVTSAVHLS